MTTATGMPGRTVSAPVDERPLVAHVIFRLAVGGLENGLVNLINAMPAERFRHAIICLDDYTDFARRIRRSDIGLYALHKRQGHDFRIYVRLWQLLRRLRPAIVHTRNVGAVECNPVAAVAGVGCRIHGEHGWDVADLHGRNRRYSLLRRLCTPFISRYVTVSQHIEHWLAGDVGVPAAKIRQIYNGVDTERFSAAQPGLREGLGAGLRTGLPSGFAPDGTLVVGTVGRMQAVKNPLGLVDAFVECLNRLPDARQRLRLVMLGDGTLKAEALARLDRADAGSLAWLPGAREDVPELLKALDVFVLPSLNEGISNTVLEAMATGLPVVATRVGGNPELVVDGETGTLVTSDDVGALATAIGRYAGDVCLRHQHGAAGRHRVEAQFSLDSMVGAYLSLYDELLARGPTVSAA